VHVLNSLDHAQQWDNKVDINIEGHNTLQDMLEAVGSCVSSPPHHNMGRENQCIKIPSHIHPFPLHSDIFLWDLHRLKDIENARNHFLKLVEAKVNQYVTIPWELPIPLPVKVQHGMFRFLPYMLKKFN
jgi:hypothetical protein